MGSGGMVVMDVDVTKYFLSFTSEESCGKCIPCRQGIEHMFWILEEITEERGTMAQLDELEETASVVKGHWRKNASNVGLVSIICLETLPRSSGATQGTVRGCTKKQGGRGLLSPQKKINSACLIFKGRHGPRLEKLYNFTVWNRFIVSGRQGELHRPPFWRPRADSLFQRIDFL